MKTSRRLLLFVLAALLQTIFIVLAGYRFQQIGNQRNILSKEMELELDEWYKQQSRARQKRVDPLAMTKRRHPFVGSHPNRVSGYRYNDSQTYYGYVMRDLVTRIGTHQGDGSSIVLVVSPCASLVTQFLEQNGDDGNAMREEDIGFEVGGSILLNTAKQGHNIIGLSSMDLDNGTDGSLMPDQWWANSTLRQDDTQADPQDILLAVVDGGEMNDKIITQSIHFLNEAAIKYLVVGVGVDSDGSAFGKKVVLILQKLGYRVQILSSSHFPNTTSSWVPNALISRPKNIQSYFNHMREYAKESKTPVRGYLFATHGLDLAIPSASVYISSPKDVHVDRIDYRKCPQTITSIDFVDMREDTKSSSLDNVRIMCGGVNAEAEDVWHSHSTIEASEAICARVYCNGKQSSVCTTRIIPNVASEVTKRKKPAQEATQQAQNSNRPNLLVLMIDPISRARFEHSLPKTSRLLQRLNFTSFSRFTAVANASRPTRAALYAGLHQNHHDGEQSAWLWETLKKEGYSTFKADDACVGNSPLSQTIEPEADHGDALSRMMCFDFQRPNCVGGMSAEEHLVNHTHDFINQYSALNHPWAAFAHFVDPYEDSMTLEGILDAVLWKALFSLYEETNELWNNTMIVVTSSHGMHYGSYSSSPQGLLEQLQPILYIRPPEHFRDSQKRNLDSNKDSWTTPFDVHESILNVVAGSVNPTAKGRSLLTPLPGERKYCNLTSSIPLSVCDILHGRQEPGLGKMMANPPSILSFYADIPQQHKRALGTCPLNLDPPLFSSNETCRCATSNHEWFNCSTYPKVTFSETFSMVQCGNQMSFDVHVKADPFLMNRREVQDAKTSGASMVRPNILFIEIDSVSFAYADRHFPRTRELLHRHRIQQSSTRFDCKDHLCSTEFPYFSVTGANSIPNQVSTFSGCIVTTGPERCTPTQQKNGAGTDWLCNDETNPVFGLHLANVSQSTQTWCPTKMSEEGGRDGPWIFDIARRAGYVTLFAEEFCFDDSPYVAQDNIYSLNADIYPHRLFCRLAKAKEPRLQEWTVKLDSPCVGTSPTSMVALDHIRQMWDSYPETSKFAYLNAIAAHDYRPFPSMTMSAEAYDGILSSFLEDFLERQDAHNTIIVVRSDHGLPGGETTIDYSTQIEAFRPWNELVVPEKLPHVSLDIVERNQGRLVTAADLYRALAEVMTTGGSQLMPTPPAWTTNIFNTSISKERTCSDAMVPLTYCLFENERTFTAPNLGTCNLAPSLSRQDIFCPQLAEYLQHEMADEVDHVLNTTFATSGINFLVCPNEGYGNSEYQVKQWKEIDELIESFPSPRVSGGIFLYPFQTSLISAILGVLGANVFAEEGRNLIACETGFGSGHSAALLLESIPHVHVHTFDKFDRPHQFPIVRQLESSFKGRITHHQGDSCETVPKVLSTNETTSGSEKAVRCDFLHGSSLCRRDNIDLVESSPCGVILTSTAMHSLKDNAVYFGKNGQWSQLANRGCIRDITCFEEKEQLVGRDLLFQRRHGPKPFSHKFCLAITTGKCSKRTNDGVNGVTCNSKMARFTNLVDIGRICPRSKNRIPDKVVEGLLAQSNRTYQ